MKKLFSLCLILIGLLSHYSTVAQFNIKVSYNINYFPLATTNTYFKQYNQNPLLTQKYKPFHFLQGLDLGVRYMFNHRLSAEASWVSNFSTNNKSSIVNTSQTVKDEWRLSQRMGFLGLENNFGYFGLGAHFGYGSFSFLKEIIATDRKQSVLKVYDFYTKINLTFRFQSQYNEFAIKPYYVFPLTKDKNIATINQILNGSQPNITTEKFSMFGLAFVFYNGPQRD